MLEKFKKKIGLNLFALLGYFPIVFLTYDYIHSHFHYLLEMGIYIYGFIQGCLILLSLIILVIEQLCKHEIKNKYILENKIYNIFWLIGFTSSSLWLIFFIYEVILALQALGCLPKFEP